MILEILLCIILSPLLLIGLAVCSELIGYAFIAIILLLCMAMCIPILIFIVPIVIIACIVAALRD